MSDTHTGPNFGNTGLPRVSAINGSDADCSLCGGSGWVCENHLDREWIAVCECGAGAPCKCNPLNWPGKWGSS